MEEPLKGSAPTKSGSNTLFFVCHIVSYLAFAVMGIVAMVVGSLDKTHNKMIFSMKLASHKDFDAGEIEMMMQMTESLIPGTNITRTELVDTIFPVHGMLMIPEKALLYMITIWMVICSVAAMVILIMKGFSDRVLNSIAFSKWGKWTSLAILCTCCELFIPWVQEKQDHAMRTKPSRYRNIASLLLSMCALIIIVMGYGTGPKCQGSDYAFYYKKVCLSTFYAFHLLNSIFSLVDLEFFKKSEELYDGDDGKKGIQKDHWEKKFYHDQASNSWVMMCLVGCSIAAIAYLVADICMPIFICFFQLGYLILSTGIPKKAAGKFFHYNHESEPELFNFSGLKYIKISNIVASVIMMVFLIVVAGLIYFFKKDKFKE